MSENLTQQNQLSSHLISPETLIFLKEKCAISEVSYETLMHSIDKMSFVLKLIGPNNPLFAQVVPPNLASQYRKDNMRFLFVSAAANQQFDEGLPFNDEADLYEIVRDENAYYMMHTFYQTRELTESFVRAYPDTVAFYLNSRMLFDNKVNAEKLAENLNYLVNFNNVPSDAVKDDVKRTFCDKLILSSVKDQIVDQHLAIEKLLEMLKTQSVYMVEIVAFMAKYQRGAFPVLNSVSVYPEVRFSLNTAGEKRFAVEHLFNSMVSMEREFFMQFIIKMMQNFSENDLEKNAFVEKLCDEGITLTIGKN